MTIVVPLYDEAAGVADLIAALRRLPEHLGGDARRPIDWVLVDDGSRDATWDLLGEHLGAIDAGRGRRLRHEHNRGLTAALRTGSATASGGYVGWLDSDLTYDPEILLALARQLDEGADVACASCYHPEGAVRGVPGWRRALSGIASAAWRRLAPGGTPPGSLHTYTSMVRVWRRDVLEACWPRRGGFLGVTECLLRAVRHGYRVAETPAVLNRRRVGQSKMRVLRVGFGQLGLMVAWLLRRV